MSSRRKQSKPIGLIETVQNTTTDIITTMTNTEDDESSSTSSSSSSNTANTASTTYSVAATNESNVNKVDISHNSNMNEKLIEDDKQSSNQIRLVQDDTTQEIKKSNDLDHISDASEELISKKDTIDEISDKATPDENAEIVESINQNHASPISHPRKEILNTMKRKRSYDDEDAKNEYSESENVPNYPNHNNYSSNIMESLNDSTNEIEDEEDEENDEDCIFDDYSMNENYSLNDDYSSQQRNYYNDHNKRIMLSKHNENHNFNGDNRRMNGNSVHPMLYNAMTSNLNGYQKSDSDNVVTSMLLMFKCKVCGKGFKHRRSLNRHVKLHSGEKNFHCPYCSTAFARSDHLKAHIRTHNNSKPFRCSICQCGYSTQAALKVHIAHHHSKSKFKCVICNDLEFHSQLALEGHIYKIHSKENTELDLESDEKTEPQLTLVTSRLNNKGLYPSRGTTMNVPNNIRDIANNSIHNVNFNNSYNRVQLADINNYQKENSPDYFEENASFRNNEQDENMIEYNAGVDDDDSVLVENNNEQMNDSCENMPINEENESVHNETQDHTNNESETNGNGEENEFNLSTINDDQDAIQDQDLDELDNSHKQSVVQETVTFIDNYGEDDDEQPNLKKKSESNDSKESVDSTDDVTVSKANDDDDETDVIIEESLSTEKSLGLKQPTPKIMPVQQHVNNVSSQQRNLKPPTLLPAPNMNGPNTRPVKSYNIGNANANRISSQVNNHNSNSSNTYCEMCNARFSNVESFMAHMRNCHPNISYQQRQHSHFAPSKSDAELVGPNQPNKMPYLTSILAKNGDSSKKIGGSSQITPVINKLGAHSNVMPMNHGPKSNCTIPNCNCSSSANNRQSSEYDHHQSHRNSLHASPDIDAYSIKETHYTCGQCNLTLFKAHDYMNHLKQEHCVEVFRCILCKQMQLFDNLNLLKEHFAQVHQSIKTEYFRCRMCPMTNSTNSLFTNIEDLNAHVQQVHNSASGHTNRPMNIHQRISVGPMPPPQMPPHNIYQNSYPPHSYPPSHNGPPYTRQPRSSLHLNGPQSHSHNGYNTYSKCFKCQYCDSDFAQQNSLNQHIQMVHNKNIFNGEKSNIAQQASVNGTSFACQYCRNTFTNRQQLERHVRIHVSSIDLKCNICDKQFTTQESLSQHKLTHCKTFNTTSNGQEGSKLTDALFDSNSSSVQSNNSGSSAICVYCKHSIENETQFKEHFKRHNNIGQNNSSNNCKVNSFICIVCRQTLSSNNEYNLHMRHHLRRVSSNGNNNQNVVNSTTNSTPNLKNQSPEKSDNNVEKNNETESPEQLTDSQKNQTSSKLRCSKCHVKFEEWRELADHIAKAHPSNKDNESQQQKNSENTPKQQTTPITEKESQLVNVKAEKFDSLPASTTNETQNNSNLESLNSSPRSIPSGSNTSSNDGHCEICSSKFDSVQKLQAHLLIKHEFNTSNGVYTCPVCDESYSRPESLLAHANIHGHAARIYKCTQCVSAFVFKSQLINHSFSHQPNHHSNKVYQKSNLPQQAIPHFNTPSQITNAVNSLNHHNHQSPSFNGPIQKRDMPPHMMGNRPRMQPGSYGSPSINPTYYNRFKCSECNIVFESFRTYQLHNQSFHGRTVILNGHANPNSHRIHSSSLNRHDGMFNGNANDMLNT